MKIQWGHGPSLPTPMDIIITQEIYRFRHNQLKKPVFGQITEFQVINIEG